MRNLIAPTAAMGYSQIFLDLMSDRESARHFYATASIYDAATQVERRTFPRAELSDILKRQNMSFGCGQATLDNIETLRQESNSLCVVTGQQAGLLGGPMLVALKAMGAIKSAKLYARQLRRPVVPVFWIAGDDHDYEEVNHTSFLNRATEPVTVSYAVVPSHELPTAQLHFEDADALAAMKDSLQAVLGESDFTPEIYAWVQEAYSGDDTYVSGFGKLMTRLFTEYGLVLFSPGDPDVKKLAQPFFEQVVKSQDQIHSRLNRTNDELQKAGYHLQVEKAEDAAHLFCIDDDRIPVRRVDGHFVLGDKTVTPAELLQHIAKSPERFSTDVMTRPVLQSWLFPVICQKCGPAEIAYLAQNQKLFELFDLTPPFLMARPSATIAETRVSKLINDYHITFRELTGDFEQVINRVLASTFPANLEKGVEQLRQDIEYHISEFSADVLKFDPALTKVSKQTYGKIDFLLNGLQGKVFASHKRKSNETRERLYRVYNALYPNRGLQERSLNILYFISRYGFDFMCWLYREIDSEDRNHQMIDLTDCCKK